MTRDETRRLRRYVLGAATDEESAALEREYVERASALDRVAAVEDDLIDDYLLERLAQDERHMFETRYLASPRHRMRVAVVRRLHASSSAGSRERRRATLHWWPALAVAATLVALVAAGVWFTPSIDSTPPGAAPSTPAGGTEPRGTQPPAAPATVALLLSPIAVRAGGEPPTLVIPAGTEVVALLLEGEAGEPAVERGRAVVRTVAGDEVWRGPATPAAGAPPQALARLELPAGRLPPDDYIVELFDAGGSGGEVERHRYFLRVRAQ